jgi:hypothetical protein
MGIFDFLAPDINQGKMNQQTKLAQKAANAPVEGQKKAIGALDTGLQQARPHLRSAVDLFKGITDDRQNATDMYFNSLGLNGPEGNQAAIGAYQQSPGYGFALDQANQNVLRNQAATGALNSGGTLMGLSDRARELQNLDYGNWQTRLQGLDVLPAATGQASQLQNLGGLFERTGQNKAGVYGQFAPQISQGMNNQASLIGQQQSAQMAAEQQGWANALGIGSMLTGGLGAYWGKNS